MTIKFLRFVRFSSHAAAVFFLFIVNSSAQDKSSNPADKKNSQNELVQSRGYKLEYAGQTVFPNPYPKSNPPKWDGVDAIQNAKDYQLQLSSLTIYDDHRFLTLTEKGPYLLEFKLQPDIASSINVVDVGTEIVNESSGSDDGYEGVDIVKQQNGAVDVFVVTDHGKIGLIKKDSHGKWQQATEIFPLAIDLQAFVKERHPNYGVDEKWEGIAIQTNGQENTIWASHESGLHSNGNRGALLVNLTYEPNSNVLKEVTYLNSWVVDLQHMLFDDLRKHVTAETKVEATRLPDYQPEKHKERYVKLGYEFRQLLQDPFVAEQKSINDNLEWSDQKKEQEKAASVIRFKGKLRDKYQIGALALEFRICALELYNHQLWALASWYYKDNDEGYMWLINLGDPSEFPVDESSLLGEDFVMVPKKYVQRRNWEGLAMRARGDKIDVFLISDDAPSTDRWEVGKPPPGDFNKQSYMLHLELSKQ